MWVDTPQGRKTWYAGRWITETEWNIITQTDQKPTQQQTTTAAALHSEPMSDSATRWIMISLVVCILLCGAYALYIYWPQLMVKFKPYM